MSTQADLPDAVAQYIQSADSHDTDALVATLTDDAVVDDEGRVHSGKEDIRAWNKNSVAKFACAESTGSVCAAIATACSSGANTVPPSCMPSGMS